MKIRRHGVALGCALVGMAAVMAPLGAQAQSSVTLYGLVGADMASTKRSDTPTRTVAMQSPGLTAPFWGMRGTEDLGGGYHAIFALESFFQPTNGAMGRKSTDPFWSRNAYVGLSGDFGKLTLGRQTNLLYRAEQAVNPFKASVLFSPLVVQTFMPTYGGAIIGDTVWNNNIQYSTPEMRGLTVTGVCGVSNVAGQGGLNNVALAARYVSGPLVAVAVAQRNRMSAVAPSTGQDAYLAGLAYNFKVVELTAAIQTANSLVTEARSQTYALGATIPVMRTGDILLAWAFSRHAAPRVATTTRNTASAGYDYHFSKLTDVYAVAMYDKLTSNPGAMTYAVGIRHAF